MAIVEGESKGKSSDWMFVFVCVRVHAVRLCVLNKATVDSLLACGGEGIVRNDCLMGEGLQRSPSERALSLSALTISSSPFLSSFPTSPPFLGAVSQT